MCCWQRNFKWENALSLSAVKAEIEGQTNLKNLWTTYFLYFWVLHFYFFFNFCFIFCFYLLWATCSWTRSVDDKETIFWLEDPGRIPVESRFSVTVQRGHESHPAFRSMGGRVSFPGVKRLVCGSDHPKPCSAEVVNRCSHSSILYLCLHGKSLGWPSPLPHIKFLTYIVREC